MKEEDKSQAIILWGYDAEGHPCIDSFHEIKDLKKAAEVAKMMDLRSRFQANVQMALIYLPKGTTAEDLENFFKYSSEKAIKRLKEARVSLRDMLREKNESNAIDFILN